ncbi:MAG: hypothetical protein AAF718_14070 [Pseudomonadota bacterium]
MKTVLLALATVPLFATASLAETSDRAAFAPIGTNAEVQTAAVKRDRVNAGEAISKPQAPIRVTDVDADNDGQVSFAELLQHRSSSGF